MFNHNFLDELMKNENIIKTKSIGEKSKEIIVYKEKNIEYSWNYLFLDQLEENTIKFSIKSSFRETIPPKWPLELINSIKFNLKKYYINVKHGDVICIEDFRNQSNLAGFILIREKTENIFNLVPLFEKELCFLELVGSKKVIDLLYHKKVDWKDLSRESIIDNIDFNQFYSPDLEFDLNSHGKYQLLLGIDDFKFLQYNFLDSLANGKDINIIGDEIEVILSLGGSFGVEVEEHGLYKINFSKKDILYLKKINNYNKFLILIPNVNNFEITLKKTFFRNNIGEIIG